MVEDKVEVKDKIIKNVEDNDQFLVQRSPCNQVSVRLPDNDIDISNSNLKSIVGCGGDVKKEQIPWDDVGEQKFIPRDNLLTGVVLEAVSYPSFVSEEDDLEEVNSLQSAFATAKVDTDTDGN